MNPNHENQLIERLKALPPFLFMQNPGNGGDSLIARATIDFFKQHNLTWLPFTESRFRSNKNVVCNGGGGFLPQYRDPARFIEENFDSFETFTLLPHTIVGHKELLSKADKRFHFFARELPSYEHLTKSCTSASYSLTHDMAFQLDLSTIDLGTTLPFLRKGQSIKRQYFWLTRHKPKIEAFWNSTADSEKKYFIRQDSESAPNIHLQEKKEQFFDLSNILCGEMEAPDQIEGTCSIFMNQVYKAGSVVTDRLHVAIACALLGKPCEFYSNSYFKNQAIYEYSLKEKFRNIAFVG